MRAALFIAVSEFFDRHAHADLALLRLDVFYQREHPAIGQACEDAERRQQTEECRHRGIKPCLFLSCVPLWDDNTVISRTFAGREMLDAHALFMSIPAGSGAFVRQPNRSNSLFCP